MSETDKGVGSSLPPEAEGMGATGKAAEYLEKLVFESFKRELDQEENVVRSLPFFATSIGALLAFLGFARSALPSFSLDWWPFTVYLLLSCVLISLTILVFHLFESVRQRSFTYPMNERELIDYATQLTAYYREVSGNTPVNSSAALRSMDDTDPVEVIEQAVVDDLRKTMLDQTAIAAQNSRTNNSYRLRARARAFTCLMIALGFATMLIIAILIHDALNGGPNAQNVSTSPRSAISQRSELNHGQKAGKAEASGDAGGLEGRLELRRSPLQPEATEHEGNEALSSQRDSSSSSSPPASSAPLPRGSSTSPTKPAAPPMTVQQKGEPTVGQQTRE